MGRASLEGMLGQGLDIDAVLEWHLRHNHCPPLPLSLIPVAKQAIEHAQAEDWDVEVPMPDGVAFRGKRTAPVHLIIETMHLAEFLNQEEG